MKTPLAIAAWVVLLSAMAGCDHDGPHAPACAEACECVGDLIVSVPIANVPDKIHIVWQGNVVVDECNPVQAGPVIWEKNATGLIANDGGFGFTPPPTFDLTVGDLKDCVAPPSTIVEVVDYPVLGAPFEVCSRAEITLEPS